MSPLVLLTLITFLVSFNELGQCRVQDPILLIHGGAGTINERRAEEKKIGMIASIRAGFEHLLNSDNPMDAVEAAIHVMENSPAFNAGFGSVLTDTGEVEMDAIIVNGTDLSTGAIGAMKHVRNPITVARLVLNSTKHVFLVGEFAEKFAASQGIELVPTSDLIPNDTMRTDASQEVFNTISRINREGHDGVGTCGAIAINSRGQIAAATSTGGLSGKMEGRVGDSPIIGAGTLADDEIGGISGTGTGEAFIRYRVASKIADLIAKGVNPSGAISTVLNGMTAKIPTADGGAIAITKDGQIGYQWNSRQMAWAYAKKSENMIHFGVNRGEDFIEPLN